MGGPPFPASAQDVGRGRLLSLLRAATSFSLIVAYANIATGAASIIHFMYPLAVAAAMILFFGERRSVRVLAAIALSVAGTVLLSSGNTGPGTAMPSRV